MNREIKELKAKLEMYENGVYYSSENDKLQEEIERLQAELDKTRLSELKKEYRIFKAIEYINDNLYAVGNDVNGSDLPYDEAIQPLLDILHGSDINVS